MGSKNYIGIVAPTPGSKEGESGHTATKMMVEVMKRYHDGIYIFTRDTFKSDFPERNIFIHKFHKPYPNSSFLKRMLGMVIYQSRIAKSVINHHDKLRGVIFGGWGMVIPLLACKIFKIKSIQRIGGHPIKVVQSRSEKLFLINKIRLYLAKIAMNLGFSLSSYIVIISPVMRDFIGLNKYADKVRIWNHYYFKREEFNYSIEFSKRDNIIGFVGIINSEKGVSELIDAFPRVLKYCPDSKLLIIGDGPYLSHMKEKVRVLELDDKVEFTGFIPREKMKTQMNRMKLFVLPTKHEGLPKVILEAMACGTPVLTTSVGDIPDTIKDGENGYLLSNSEPDNITDKIINVLSDNNLSETSYKSREYIKEHYSFEAALNRYEKNILEIL